MAVSRRVRDEHEGRAVAGDDVQFATTPAVAPRNYCVPAPLELLAREIFARFPENLSAGCHVATSLPIRGPATTINAETAEYADRKRSAGSASSAFIVVFFRPRS